MKISTVQEAVARHEEPVPVPILDENGDPHLAADGVTHVVINVVGSESKRVKAARDRQTRRIVRHQRTNPTPEELRADRAEIAAAAADSWIGIEAEDNQPVPCTPKNAQALLSSADYILIQVENGVNRHASFFDKSSSG